MKATTMKTTFSRSRLALCAVLSTVAAGLWAFGLLDAGSSTMLATGGAVDLSGLMKSLDSIELKLKGMSEKADAELKDLGKVTTDTKTALDNIGTQQREFADRLMQLEQKGSQKQDDKPAMTSWGEQFVKNSRYADFAGGHMAKLRVEVKNTLVGSGTNVAPDRRPGIVAGAFQPFSMEALLPSTGTSSNAIEFTKENVFTNSAAEAAEGSAKAESALTWTLVNMPVSTVAHWIKISKQLAAGRSCSGVLRQHAHGVRRQPEGRNAAGHR